MNEQERGAVATGGPASRLVMVAGVAIIALGAASLTIWKSPLTAEFFRPKPRPTPPVAANPSSPQPDWKRKGTETQEAGAAIRPIDEEELAFWTEVSIFKPGPSRPHPIVVMKRGKQPETASEGLYQGLLAREVVRQALLLTAREELGAITRDVPIGDPDVPGTPDVSLRIGSRFRKPAGTTPDDPPCGRITIVRGEGAGREVLWTRQFECEVYHGPHYAWLVAELEIFSRLGFRKVLEGLGLSRVAPAPVASGPDEIPVDIRDRLSHPVETEQFAAIRSLHEMIRTGGETRNRLLALAEAYAQLGSLAESQWTADSEALQARGLLYAQRAVVRDRRSPESLRGQAYVEMLSGMYVQPIWLLDEVVSKEGGKPAPDRDTLIRAFGNSDAPALARYAAAHPTDLWTSYLQFLTALRSSGACVGMLRGCRHEILAASGPILKAVPDCFRVIDGLTQMAGVALLHEVTATGYDLYPKAIRDRLAATPGLPTDVLRQPESGDEPAEVTIRKRMVAAAAEDRADVTWGVLARQFREIRYTLVARRIHFATGFLNVPPQGFADDGLRFLADHPNRGYVESYSTRGSRNARELFRSLDLSDVQMKGTQQIFPLERLDPERFERIKLLPWAHTSAGTVPAHVWHTEQASKKQRWISAQILLKYHPGSPLGRAITIEERWEDAKSHAEQWAKDHGGTDTPVLAALGMHALAENDLEQAERMLKQALAQSPESWIFEGLAAVYEKKGNVASYVAAAVDFLKTRDLGLDHASVTDRLANYLMKQGKYREARPFAEYAARSWAGWAMRRASQCAEGMEDWEAAELWISRCSERYPEMWLDWAFWCLRTGHGDRRAAAQLVEDQLEAGRGPSSDSEQYAIAFLLLLEGKPKPARRMLEALYQQHRDTATGVYLAYACDRDGDARARDAMLKKIAEDPKPAGPNTAKLMGILHDWLSRGDQSPLDLKAIEAIVAKSDQARLAGTSAFLGLFLDGHGKPDAARPHLERGDSDACYAWARFLVREARRARGIELKPIPAP